MKHLTEEQLILYYYHEAADRASVERHLAVCDDCRANYDQLQNVLLTVNADSVPERAENYGAEVWQRVRPRLKDRAAFGWRAFLQPRRLATLATVAALLVMAFLVGRFWPRPEVTAPQVISEKSRDRILLLAVGEHLDRSQMVLVELLNTPATNTVDISSEQQRAEDLVTANRLYRQTAARAGEAGIASVLDDLERVLLEIARSPSELSASDLGQIRQRIESQRILFKVRVIDSHLRERERQDVPQSVTGKI